MSAEEIGLRSEVMLLAVVGARGRRDILLDWNSDVVSRQAKRFGPGLTELGISRPTERGLHIFEGTVEPHRGILLRPEGRTPGWRGTWRRATAEEAARFAAGERVWP